MTAARKIPCPYPDEVLDVFAGILTSTWGKTSGRGSVIDPFAGTGRIVELATRVRLRTIVGIELESEFVDDRYRDAIFTGSSVWPPTYPLHAWWRVHERLRGDDWQLNDPLAIATSIVFPNGMTDHHEATDDSKRMTYRHALGRPLTDGSTAMHAWGRGVKDGRRWKRMHVAWLATCLGQMASLSPRSRRNIVMINVKDHYHDGEIVPVTAWVRDLLELAGGRVLARVEVPVDGMGFGANQPARGSKAGLKLGYETVLAYSFLV